MVGKNNKFLKQRKFSNKDNKYAIRKFAFGSCSVLIASFFIFAGVGQDSVYAQNITEETSTSATTEETADNSLNEQNDLNEVVTSELTNSSEDKITNEELVTTEEVMTSEEATVTGDDTTLNELSNDELEAENTAKNAALEAALAAKEASNAAEKASEATSVIEAETAAKEAISALNNAKAEAGIAIEAANIAGTTKALALAKEAKISAKEAEISANKAKSIVASIKEEKATNLEANKTSLEEITTSIENETLANESRTSNSEATSINAPQDKALSAPESFATLANLLPADQNVISIENKMLDGEFNLKYLKHHLNGRTYVDNAGNTGIYDGDKELIKSQDNHQVNDKHLINNQDYLVGNVPLYMQWMDRDGTLSPIYTFKSNDNGYFAVNPGIFKVVNPDGTTTDHEFLGKQLETVLYSAFKYRIWADQDWLVNNKYDNVQTSNGNPGQWGGYSQGINGIWTPILQDVATMQIQDVAVVLQPKDQLTQHNKEKVVEIDKLVGDINHANYANDKTIVGNVYWEADYAPGITSQYPAYEEKTGDKFAEDMTVYLTIQDVLNPNNKVTYKTKTNQFGDFKFDIANVREMLGIKQRKNASLWHQVIMNMSVADSQGNQFGKEVSVFSNSTLDGQFYNGKNLKYDTGGLDASDFILVSRYDSEFRDFSTSSKPTTALLYSQTNSSGRDEFKGAGFQFVLRNTIPTIDITNYDSTDNYAAPGNKANAVVTGAVPDVEYIVRWYEVPEDPTKSPKLVLEGTPFTVAANGVFPDQAFDVPANLPRETMYIAQLETVNTGNIIAIDNFYARLKNEADTFAPVATVENIKVGETVNLIDNVTVPNYDGKPTFEDITPLGSIDNTKPGEYTGTVKVTYQDGSSETIQVPVVVTAVDVPHDSIYEPNVTPEIIKVGDTIDLADNVTVPNYVQDPKHSGVPLFEDVTPDGVIDNTTPGEYTGKVKVTYPDNTFEIVDVPVTVIDKKSDVYDPMVVPEVIEIGQTPNLIDNVTVPSYIQDSKYPGVPTFEDVTPDGVIDNTTPGEYTGKVRVTYPDGTSEIVDVPVTVKTPEASQADVFVPQVTPEIIGIGGTPDLLDNVSIPDYVVNPKYPGDIIFEDVTPAGTIDNTTPGGYIGLVKVTYPDGSMEIIQVPVTVTAPEIPQKEDYDPTVKPEIVEVDGIVDLTDNVIVPDYVEDPDHPGVPSFKDVTPAGQIDPSTPGKYTGLVEVTYPDGSKEIVTVPVTVTAPEVPDKDSYDPTVTPEVIEQNGNVHLVDNVTVPDYVVDPAHPGVPSFKDVTPEGTIDLNEPGKYTGLVEVTYPDGSTEIIQVPVTITTPETPQADDYTPVVTPEIVEAGDPIDLTDNVTVPGYVVDPDNLGVPSFEDVTPVGTIDTTTPGNYTGLVKVTYPDGSTEIVDVTVTVTT
ncbi:Rib/alpha-like domain-containing protein, partial [Facklamia sp. P13055]|uniref:Rib/alpha-like domain-containing protein n=2 Tax=Facklamia TaxID=66831 RepID=UPI003D16E13C